MVNFEYNHLTFSGVGGASGTGSVAASAGGVGDNGGATTGGVVTVVAELPVAGTGAT